MSTDNANLPSKLALRRSFLREVRPPEGGKLRVFDACQGEGVIWGTLRREFPTVYLGVDEKPKAGRLRVDSALVLARPGWRYDVVDIDTYRQPWRHWAQVVANGSGRMTVFLTIGESSGIRSQLSNDGMDALGLTALADVMPYGIRFQLTEFVVDHIIAKVAEHGWSIERVAESPRSIKARYVGVRMTRAAATR